MGRALDEAHPGVVPAVVPKKVADVWADEEPEPAEWRTA